MSGSTAKYTMRHAPAWYYALPRDQRDQFERGEPIWIGGQCWQICPGCSQGVHLNKRLFGSLHLCAPPEQRR